MLYKAGRRSDCRRPVAWQRICRSFGIEDGSSGRNTTIVMNIEEAQTLQLDFTKTTQIAAAGHQVIPAIAQDVRTGVVLIVGYANAQALEASRRSGLATFFSTSRGELWVKGATSGDFLDLVEIRVNCEQNSVLYLVRPRLGSACHTKQPDGRNRYSCFYRKLGAGEALEFLENDGRPTEEH